MAIYKDVASLEVVGYTEPKGGTFSNGVQFILEKLDAIPEADVEHVRHGYWILTQKISENAFRYNCSECNRWVQDGAGKNPSDRFPYCHCGAKMDGKENKE